jgi:septum formation protein
MLYLASRSPRRAELLRQIGRDFAILDVEVAEIRAPDESAEKYVCRVTHDKAAAGLARVSGQADAVILVADTEVVLDDHVFGKPADAAAAAHMLRRLSGRRHRVLSGVCCATANGSRYALCESIVEFAGLDEGRIAAYVASGEPFGKAGGYAIQGRAAGFVRRLEGSYSGVMGMPLFETLQLLGECNPDPLLRGGATAPRGAHGGLAGA